MTSRKKYNLLSDDELRKKLARLERLCRVPQLAAKHSGELEAVSAECERRELK